MKTITKVELQKELQVTQKLVEDQVATVNASIDECKKLQRQLDKSHEEYRELRNALDKLKQEYRDVVFRTERYEQIIDKLLDM